jgi:hypothetical protein
MYFFARIEDELFSSSTVNIETLIDNGSKLFEHDLILLPRYINACKSKNLNLVQYYAIKMVMKYVEPNSIIYNALTYFDEMVSFTGRSPFPFESSSSSIFKLYDILAKITYNTYNLAKIEHKRSETKFLISQLSTLKGDVLEILYFKSIALISAIIDGY